MYSSKNNQAYKRILDSILERNGVLRPEAVVEEAKNPNSLLHNKFEWDNRKAGHQWRIHQARVLIKTIMVNLEEIGMSNYEIIIPTEEVDRVKGYYSLEEVMNDKEMKKQVLANAVKLLKYWQEKYHKYKELEDVIDSKKLRKLEIDFLK